MWRADIWNILMLGKIEGRRRRGCQSMRCLDGITDQWTWVYSQTHGSLWWTGRPGLLWFMGLPRVGHEWVAELSWTPFKEWFFLSFFLCFFVSFFFNNLGPVCPGWIEKPLKLKTQHSENGDHDIQSHHFMGNRWGNSVNSVRFYFSGLQNHYRWWWLLPWN